MQTSVLVRVQAKGGKFLGPDAGYARVTLRNASSGEVLAQAVAPGGSGQLSGAFSPAATRNVIVTPQFGTQTVLWLSATPDQATAGLTVALDLDAPMLVAFTAEALTGGEPNGHTVTQAMWLTPGVDLTTEPGVVLVMPGLNVQVLSAAVAEGERSLSVTASVAMMCGCRISPALPWLPGEFAVTATVTQQGGAFTAQVPLAWQAVSTFGTAAPVALPGPGTYDVVVNAVQAAEGNAGSASAPVAVPG